MTDFERLGVFYLGRKTDARSDDASGDLVLYDSRDLVTHGIIVGMTGSGKTGLGVTLIEEAAIDGVPVVVIDPKGDLTNLLLAFPGLSASEFEPWVSEEEASRANQTRADFAAVQAKRWREGLAAWGQDGSRIARLRESAELTIYTPGSTIGQPVSVLGSFVPPAGGDEETRRDKVRSTVSGLLTLAGVDVNDPIKSREHILLSAILTSCWESGSAVDLPALVHAVQQPPMQRVGVMDLDSFFPPKERFELATTLNGLLAAPGFEVWTRGTPLDVPAMLRTPNGKPRVAIFTLSHLDDAQRMFFVSMLLTAVAGWMRTQSGTSSLRALLYMDEIFGFFPPIANPPSKFPLLTLLKQGRAAGLGVVLATQNPVDLDYKGLSNIGTWWLGRLQTERDKARVLDGLEAASGQGRERTEIDVLLSGLRSRVFLMRNVHDEGLTVFESRWALSYLRGPLSRDEIRRLASASDARHDAPTAAARAVVPSAARTAPATVSEGGDRPVVPPDVPQFFASVPGPPDAPWQPYVYGAVDVRFANRKLKVDASRTVTRLATIGEGAVALDWSESVAVDLQPSMLGTAPPPNAVYLPLPAAAAKPRSYVQWAKDLRGWIESNESVAVLQNAATGDVSGPDETERDFRARLQQSAREARDKALDALRRKYAPKQAALEERLRRARSAHARESEQATGQKMQTAISFGATVLGAILGRRAASIGTVGRATTTMRGAGRVMKEARDVARAQENIEAIEADRQALEAEFLAESRALEAEDRTAGALETVAVRPARGGIQVKAVALVWMSAPAVSAVTR